ncbi:hypothetical protein L914_05713, partial [Phytophthora nicotianae]
MTVWKGTRKYIPYEDLKRNIETKVHHELARNRYVLKQGTPESRETRAEKAMKATIPEPAPAPVAPKGESALVSYMNCTYCLRNNYDRISQRSHPCKGGNNSNGKGGNKSRYKNSNTNMGSSDGQRSRNDTSQGRSKFNGRRNRNNDDDDSDDYGIVATTTLDLSPTIEAMGLMADANAQDPMWTGYTRQVSPNPTWFEELTPSAGKAITVGGKHQIFTKRTGTVKMRVKNTKGKEQTITLDNILFALDLQYSLLSEAVGDLFKSTFPNAKKC